MDREIAHKVLASPAEGTSTLARQCEEGYNDGIWQSHEIGLDQISSSQAGHHPAWRQDQPPSDLFCQMFT